MTRFAQASDQPTSTLPARWKPLAALLLQRNAGLVHRFSRFYSRIRALSRQRRRLLIRKSAATLAGVALLLALGHSPSTMPVAHAATIEVDEVNCTLVDAMLSAEYDASYGGCTAGSGDDIIALQTDVTLATTNSTHEYFPDVGLPAVRTTITIEGNQHKIERDTAATTPKFRLLVVDRTGDLTINETTLSGGYHGTVINYWGNLTLANSDIINNQSTYYSLSGVVHTYGNVTLTNSTISNSILTGSGIYALDGQINITNSIISGNEYFGIFQRRGEVTITDSAITGNLHGGILSYDDTTIANSTISGNGFGLINENGEVAITNSIISNNDGNGVEIDSSNLMIYNSDISGNSFRGVYSIYSDVTITNSTISNNGRSGIYTFDTMTTINNSTISDHTRKGYYPTGAGIYNGSSGIMTINSSIISRNSAVGYNNPNYSYGANGGLSGYGGGIFNSHNAELTITNSTISDNLANTRGGGYTTGV